MSQENVEIVRSGFAALAEQGVEGVIHYFTEDVVIYSIPEWPDDPDYHGHDGVRRLFRQWAENFDEFTLEPRDVQDGGDSVVGLLELTGQTKRAALPMTMEIGAVYFRNHGRTGGRTAAVLQLGAGPRSRRAAGVDLVAAAAQLRARHWQSLGG